MSGVWVFRNGVVRLVENPASAVTGGTGGGGGGGVRRKALLHAPTGEVVASYASLERKLAALGWERYYGGGADGMLRFHKRSTSVDLISLPKDFGQFKPAQMYDVVVKNRDAFRVIDV